MLDRGGGWTDLATGALPARRRGAVFGLPGAFTTTCSTHHLPGFARRAVRAHLEADGEYRVSDAAYVLRHLP